MATKDITDLQVVIAIDQARNGQRFANEVQRFANEVLEKITNQPAKVCMRALERAHKRGYLEWGISLRTAWLTQKGKDLLASQ